MSARQSAFNATHARNITWYHEQCLLRLGLALTDILVVVFSFATAYVVRFWLELPLFGEGSIRPDFYVAAVSLLVPGYVALFYIYGLYDRTNLLSGTTEYARVFNAVTTGLVLVVFTSFLQPNFVVARAWLLLAWGLMVMLAIAGRFAIRRLVYLQRRAGHFLERTLIIGANPDGLAVAEQLLQAKTSGAFIVGFVDDYLPIGSEPLPKVAVLGTSQTFASLVTSQHIDTVVIANTAITRERLLSVYTALDTLQHVEVRLVSGLFELLTTGIRVHEEAYVPMVVLNKSRITGADLLCKTVLDYGVATLVLLCLLPVFLVLAVLIKYDSPGPIIYRRRVIGQGKRDFDAFKLRTMRMEGNALLTPAQQYELEQLGKLKADPRVTRLGAFLRRYSVDELPQLVNVLRGEMSLIGPRMITLQELERFGKWKHNLLTVKPGLTGLWQVNGRSDLSYEERVHLDMTYIRNYSIWLDISILFQTIPALLWGRGAY